MALGATVLAAGAAAAQPAPGWDDAPAMLAAAMAPLDADLRACLTTPGPRTITVIVSRDRDGATVVAMPLPASVGHRGLTPEERCLLRTVPRATVPPLPPPLERIAFAHVIGGSAAADPALADWRAPATTVAAGLEPVRGALAACDARPRVVRLIVDRRRARTRVWLPAWQFHAPSGDGSTPPRQRKVKACLTRAIRGVTLPLLPRTLGDLEVAVPTTP